MPVSTSTTMYAGQDLSQIQKWVLAQKLKSPAMKGAPLFYRNLEAALDERRAGHNLVTTHRFEHKVDFSSNDFLSLATSGILREAFLEELDRNPGFEVGSTGSRISDGNNSYVEELEAQIAKFHGAESALVVGSGYDANCAIFSAVPRPGDVIVYDELIHASVHDGMKASLATSQMPFKHNSAESLRETLVELKESNTLIRQGSRCVLIAVEAVYSMDGDVTPLADIVETIDDIFPNGNAQIVIDEAHSTGLVGENGRGLVCALGLEDKIAIRLHTYGKGLGTTGAAILANATVISTLLNFARPVIYTTAPSFPMLAAIRAGYNLMESGHIQKASRDRLQDRVQHLVRHFCETIEADANWGEAVDAGICSIPVSEDIDARPLMIAQEITFGTGSVYFLRRSGHFDGEWRHVPRKAYSSPPAVTGCGPSICLTDFVTGFSFYWYPQRHPVAGSLPSAEGGETFVHDGAPPTPPPLVILEAMVNPYFDSINPLLPIWSKNAFTRRVAECQSTGSDAQHRANIVSFNNVVLLTLTAKHLRATAKEQPTSPPRSRGKSIDSDLHQSFLANAARAVHDIEELLAPRLDNVQALLSLYLVAVAHWSTERASLLMTLAVMTAKSIGLHKWEPLEGQLDQDEVEDRRQVFYCLYILENSRCWTDGRPPDITMTSPDIWLAATQSSNELHRKLAARAGRIISELDQDMQRCCSAYDCERETEQQASPFDMEFAIASCAIKIFTCQDLLVLDPANVGGWKRVG
ncbi:class II aminotransferase/8-amino-7-oxononanoate synthase [Purpureocillium lavendulum]|uniref:Class II aminotransferase/8-amino-7-oxononanoate synthase n=1 Tax=Purpureocillium lavendulum TaxID=1247861 RepID=A0AB34FVD7_9HYPO|nr:class II aminotransferase/8-amino-7-oxononanoate synthase [Purpureocillium lavendulum]